VKRVVFSVVMLSLIALVATMMLTAELARGDRCTVAVTASASPATAGSSGPARDSTLSSATAEVGETNVARRWATGLASRARAALVRGCRDASCAGGSTSGMPCALDTMRQPDESAIPEARTKTDE
jgi:hypothetical protein